MNYVKNKFLYKIQMICYDRIDFSERIDVNKTSESKECNVCQYCYFLSKMSLNLSQMSSTDAMIY